MGTYPIILKALIANGTFLKITSYSRGAMKKGQISITEPLLTLPGQSIGEQINHIVDERQLNYALMIEFFLRRRTVSARKVTSSLNISSVPRIIELRHKTTNTKDKFCCLARYCNSRGGSSPLPCRQKRLREQQRCPPRRIQRGQVYV